MTDTLRTFDAGIPGNDVIGGTNGIASVLEGSAKYISGFHGAAAFRIGSPSNTTTARIRVELGLTGDHYGSVYLINNTAHGSGSSSVNFFHLVSNSNAFLAQFRVAPSNALSIRVNNIEVRAGTAGDIPVGSWFRLDWQLTGTTMNWRVFYNPEGTTADLSGSVTTVNGPADAVILATLSTSSIIKDWSFDTVRATNTGTWFGPYSTPPAGPPVTFWNGTSEVPVAISLWNGTSEVPVTVETV